MSVLKFNLPQNPVEIEFKFTLLWFKMVSSRTGFCSIWNCVKERNRTLALPKTTNSPIFIKIDRSKMDLNALMTIPELGLLDFIGF